jgi:sugar phosphate isomerase/epimerase
MNRREFVTQVSASLAGPFSVPALVGAKHRPAGTKHKPPPAPDRNARIAISSWSFHNDFPETRDQEATAPGAQRLVLLDFPEMIANRFKVHNLEIVARHFVSTETTFLLEMKGRLSAAGARLVNMPVDTPEVAAGSGLSSTEEDVRYRAVTAVKRWIDIAKQLGARSVSCNPGTVNPDNLTATVESYRFLADYVRSRGLYLLIEPTSGQGALDPELVVNVLKRTASDSVGALPSFGNFADEAARARGLEMLLPYARTVCQASGLDFDASGNETRFDFAKAIATSKQSSFRGIYSISYEGAGDPYQGVQNVISELQRYLG